jgi:hypothetical protein
LAEKSGFVNTIGYILRRRLQERTYHQLCITRFQLLIYVQTSSPSKWVLETFPTLVGFQANIERLGKDRRCVDATEMQ